jgi:hypothetical protein
MCGERNVANGEGFPERAASRQAQKLGRAHGTADAEQVGDLLGLAVDAGAVVGDEEGQPGAVWIVDLDAGAFIERIVDEFLEHEPPQARGGNTSILLEALDRSEQRPILPLRHFPKAGRFRRLLSLFWTRAVLGRFLSLSSGHGAFTMATRRRGLQPPETCRCIRAGHRPPAT